MWMIGETVFTEAELKAYLRSKPKKKVNSIPNHLVGSSYRAPFRPECLSVGTAVGADLRKEIIDTECGEWLREEDATLMSATPVPVGAHDGTRLDLPGCLDRRVKPHLLREAA
jgi:hypothetical protein